MSDRISLSIFTVEADRLPVFAVQCKKSHEAEAVSADESLRDQLAVLKSGGKPLCDDFSIFRVRLARQAERQMYYQNAASLLAGTGVLAVLFGRTG
jgi:hypothetical protein